MEIRPWEKLQNALPPLSKDEFEELKNSIEQHGVLQKILVLPDGRIIDGYHRWVISGENAPYQVIDLHENEAFELGIMLNAARRNIPPEVLKAVREALYREKEKCHKIVCTLHALKKSNKEIAEMVGLTVRSVQKLIEGEFTEELHRNEWAVELGGKPKQRIKCGIVDILTLTHAWEVEPISSWKNGLGQAISYASELGLKPGLALYGPKPKEKTLTSIKNTAELLNVDLLFKMWERPEPLPGRLIKYWQEGKPLTPTLREILRRYGFKVEEEEQIATESR